MTVTGKTNGQVTGRFVATIKGCFAYELLRLSQSWCFLSKSRGRTPSLLRRPSLNHTKCSSQKPRRTPFFLQPSLLQGEVTSSSPDDFFSLAMSDSSSKANISVCDKGLIG